MEFHASAAEIVEHSYEVTEAAAQPVELLRDTLIVKESRMSNRVQRRGNVGSHDEGPCPSELASRLTWAFGP